MTLEDYILEAIEKIEDAKPLVLCEGEPTPSMIIYPCMYRSYWDYLTDILLMTKIRKVEPLEDGTINIYID